MRIRKTFPPAASPIPVIDIVKAIPSCFVKNEPSEQFAKEIQQSYGCEFSFFTSSGKAALACILLALKMQYKERTKVILPAYTCYSVPAAVKRAGLEILLCDLAPGSLDLDKNHLLQLIEQDRNQRDILCVIPTHLFGCPSDIGEIRRAVGDEIILIEDAAQAMGEVGEDGWLGSLADVGFFSLGRGKPLSTSAGGVILTDRQDIAENIETVMADSLAACKSSEALVSACKTFLTSILLNPFLFWLPKSLPFLHLGETMYEPDFGMERYSAFHTRLAVNWRQRLAEHRKARIKNVQFLMKNLPQQYDRLCRTDNAALIRFPVLVGSEEMRDAILSKSEQFGLGLMLAYPSTVSNIPELVGEFSGQNYPNAMSVSRRLLTIPVHEYISERDYDAIMQILP